VRLRGFTVDRRGLRRIKCLGWAARAYDIDMCEQGAILGAGGYDAGFRWVKGGLLGEILVRFNQKRPCWFGMLIWPDESVGDLRGTGIK
jgi:hypothetical protein